MKGQAFSTFKILIAAVFAVALLIVVYSAVSGYIPPISPFQSMKELIVQATNAPGECIARGTVEFNEGTFITAESFESPVTVHLTSTKPEILECPSTQACEVLLKAEMPVSATYDLASKVCTMHIGSDSC